MIVKIAKRVYKCSHCGFVSILDTNHRVECYLPCKGSCRQIIEVNHGMRIPKQTTHLFVRDGNTLTDREKVDNVNITGLPYIGLLPISESFAMEMLNCLPPAHTDFNSLYKTFMVGEPTRGDLYETYKLMHGDALGTNSEDTRMEINKWYYIGLNKIPSRK